MTATASVSPIAAPAASSLPPTTYQPRPSAPLHSSSSRNIDLANLTPNNIGQLRKLNSVLLPVRYSEKFYKDALKPERRDICKLALFNDMPVGNLCCRFEFPSSSSSDSSTPPPVRVYIMTLGVLAPYRRLGIASRLIKHLVTFAGPGTELDLPDPDAPAPAPAASDKKSNSASAAASDKDKSKEKAAPVPTKKYLVESIYLHVQTSNDEAREFYSKQGFSEGETIQEYYRVGVTPRSAIVLERK